MKDPRQFRAEVYRELTAIFRQVFNREEMELSDSTTAKAIPEWDSVTHVMLIVAVEQRFAIKFKIAEIAGLADVGELVDAVIRKTEAA